MLPNAAALLQLPAQRAHFAQRVVARGDLVEHDAQALRIDRLGQVVVGALLDRFDRGFDRSLRREQDDGDVRVVLPSARAAGRGRRGSA